MARGKHQRRKQNADARAAREQLQELAAEIEREETLLTAARERVEQTHAAQAMLSELIAAREDVTSDRLARLRQDLETARSTRNSARAEHQRLQRVWDRLSDRIMDAAPPGKTQIEKVEWLIEQVGMQEVILTEGIQHKGLAVEQQERLQKVRGGRNSTRGNRTRSPQDIAASFEGIGRPMLVRAAVQRAERDGEPASSGAWDRLEARFDDVMHSAQHSTQRDLVAAWNPAPWLQFDPSDPYDTLDTLGPIRPSDPATGRSRAHHRLRGEELRTQANQDARALEGAKGLLSPWSPLPRFSRTIDAMSLRHVYANAAHGAWLRAAETPVPDDADPGDEDTWSAPVPTPMVAVMAEAAYALRTAVPFWLPPAQTHGFIDAEPLPADAAETLVRMPFESVAVFFGQPLWIPPADGELDRERSGLRMAIARLEASSRVEFGQVEWHDARHGQPATVGQMLALYGGHVEGLVLLADGEGVRRDEFVWCLALDGVGPVGRAGRLAAPARVSSLSPALAAVVENTAAVAAWGRWHAPVQDDELAATSTQGTTLAAARRKAAGPVRVLNVGRTAGSGERGPATGKTVSPHRRRGHWRRQRVGAGRAETRLVWVPPTYVNASRSVDLAPTVYRLPVDVSERMAPVIA